MTRDELEDRVFILQLALNTVDEYSIKLLNHCHNQRIVESAFVRDVAIKMDEVLSATKKKIKQGAEHC